MAEHNPLAYLFKVTWSGTIGTEEIFVYSRWITSDLDVPENVIDALDTDVTDMLAQTVTAGSIPRLQGFFPAHVVWTQLKVSPWDPVTNKLKAGREPLYLVLTDAGNGSATSGLPYQIAMAMTTRSHLAGRRKYNRFYLPTPHILGTDGHGVVPVPVAQAWTTWLSLNITSRAALGLVYVNYNHGTDNGDPSTAAGCWSIKDIYLGRRLDTIRRRRNEAPEPRQTLAL